MQCACTCFEGLRAPPVLHTASLVAAVGESIGEAAQSEIGGGGKEESQQLYTRNPQTSALASSFPFLEMNGVQRHHQFSPIIFKNI